MTGLALAVAGREMSIHVVLWGVVLFAGLVLAAVLWRHESVCAAGRRAVETEHADVLAAVRAHERSWPTVDRQTRRGEIRSHRAQTPPGRLAGWLAAVALLMPHRSRARRPRLVPESQPQPAPGRHSMDGDTQPLPVNGAYRAVTAAGRASVAPPPWTPRTVKQVFADAGVPADALDAALAMEPELRRWAQARMSDPDATALIAAVRVGPNDTEMVDGDDRWLT